MPDPMARLRQLGFRSVESAQDALDRARRPCLHGHDCCARTRGGACLGEVHSLLAVLELVPPDRRSPPYTPDPRD